jgi:hypothetical protein
MSPKDRGATASPLAAAMPPQTSTRAPEETHVVATKREATDDAYLLRRRLLRWLDLHEEADRLAAALAESHATGVSMEYPETD